MKRKRLSTEVLDVIEGALTHQYRNYSSETPPYWHFSFRHVAKAMTQRPAIARMAVELYPRNAFTIEMKHVVATYDTNVQSYKRWKMNAKKQHADNLQRCLLLYEKLPYELMLYIHTLLCDTGTRPCLRVGTQFETCVNPVLSRFMFRSDGYPVQS